MSEGESKLKAYTVDLDVEVLDRLKNYVYWTNGATIAGTVRAIIAEGIERLESDTRVIQNPDTLEITIKQPGEPYPARPTRNLGPGRVQSS